MQSIIGTITAQKPTTDKLFMAWTIQNEQQTLQVLLPKDQLPFYGNIALGQTYQFNYQDQTTETGSTLHVVDSIAVQDSLDEPTSKQESEPTEKKEPTLVEKMAASKEKQAAYLDDLMTKAEKGDLPISALTTANPEASFLINNSTQLDIIYDKTNQQEEQPQKDPSKVDLGNKDQIHQENEETDEAPANPANSDVTDNDRQVDDPDETSNSSQYGDESNDLF